MKTFNPKKLSSKRLARHKIRFVIARSTSDLKTAVQEVQVLIRAKNGWTTKAIARDCALTESQVAYRIHKGESVGDRKRFRNGETWVAQEALRLTAQGLISEVAATISPKYV